MENNFEYDGKKISYILEKKKIKKMYIVVKQGIVTIKVPVSTSKEEIDEIIKKRAEWIIKNVEKQKKNEKKPKKYVNGEIFKFLGKDVILQINYEKCNKSKLKFWLGKLVIILPVELKGAEKEKQEIENLINEFYKKMAQKEVEKAMRKFIMKIGLVPNSYKIKNLKSTWGNCHSNRNISINQNVIMYSRHAIEYVCLHELCHLQFMNHSKSFWNMVEKYMPNYKNAEKELNNNI